MYLKVIQNQIGKFNLLSPNDESLAFSMGIFNDDNTLVEVDGIKALLKYSGDVDQEQVFSDPFENLREVFDVCFKDGGKWMGRTDYQRQCAVFAKVYQENYAAIDAGLVAKHKEKVQKQIEKLQKELEWNTIVPDIADDVNWSIGEKIKNEQKSVEYWIKEQSQVKEGTEKYADIQKTLDRLNKSIEKYQSYLIPEPTENQ